MKNLELAQEAKTPAVNLNAETGVIEFRGRSIPEHVLEFYQPLIDWIREYAAAPKEKTIINIELEYFNTSSAKYLLEFLVVAADMHKAGNSDLEMNWYYEEGDEDIGEHGEMYEELLCIPVNVIEVPEAEG